MASDTAAPSGWDLARWLQVAGLIAMALGLVMAWATASFISVSGLDTDDGKLFGGVLIAGAVAVYLHETRGGRWRIAAAVAGIALLAFAVYEIGDVYNGNSNQPKSSPTHFALHISIHPGTGLWLDAIGAAALIFGAVLRRKATVGSGTADERTT